MIKKNLTDTDIDKEDPMDDPRDMYVTIRIGISIIAFFILLILYFSF